MQLLDSTTPRQLSVGIAIVRVFTGVIMLAHGAQKLFQVGIAGVTQGFAGMGIPMPGIVGPLVAVLEFAGGIALILGLLTRLVSLGLAIEMLGAIFIAHLASGFFLPNGIEYVLLLFATTTALVIAGAGAFSIDNAIAGRRRHVVVDDPAPSTAESERVRRVS
ncbi:MAG: DoxX family protein [Gemmatimonadaceae bacterium]